jgi:hypothetical protein
MKLAVGRCPDSGLASQSTGTAKPTNPVAVRSTAI